MKAGSLDKLAFMHLKTVIDEKTKTAIARSANQTYNYLEVNNTFKGRE